MGLAVLLAWTPVLAVADAVPAALVGVWTVQDSACAGCDPARGPEGGAELRITPRSVQNPFGADCDRATSVEALAAEPLPSLQERLGLPARWMTSGGGRARGYRVTCPGEPSFVLFVLPDGQALMPVEAGVTLRLKPLESGSLGPAP